MSEEHVVPAPLTQHCMQNVQKKKKKAAIIIDCHIYEFVKVQSVLSV